MNISGGEKKIKNIRAMIKQPFHSVPSSNTKNDKEQISAESEISFNITPDEEELSKDINETNKQEHMGQVYKDFFTFNSKDLEEEIHSELENSRIKSEAKQLLNKTKKMIESLDSNKFTDRSISSASLIKPTTRHTTLNNYSLEYTEEIPVDSSRIIRMEKEEGVTKSKKRF